MILEADGYRVELRPEQGGTVLSALWMRPDGRSIELFETTAAGFQGGCFVMAPFVNRIADGRFFFEGKEYHIPLNRPQSGMAIHGFSRDRQWQVMTVSSDHAVLQDRVTSADHPWCYTIRLEIEICARGITLTLTLRNDGTISLPFGLGLHPFIPCDPQTTIECSVAGEFASDDRGLPIAPMRLPAHFGGGTPERVQQHRGTDLCYVDWQGQTARIDWPERDSAMTVRAGGVFRHLHLYVLTDRNVFCVEPVSHLPDAINRPALGPASAMTVLRPGESMTGSMSLSAEASGRITAHSA